MVKNVARTREKELDSKTASSIQLILREAAKDLQKLKRYNLETDDGINGVLSVSDNALYYLHMAIDKMALVLQSRRRL
jgi:hypothetical protein